MLPWIGPVTTVYGLPLRVGLPLVLAVVTVVGLLTLLPPLVLLLVVVAGVLRLPLPNGVLVAALPLVAADPGALLAAAAGPFGLLTLLRVVLPPLLPDPLASPLAAAARVLLP